MLLKFKIYVLMIFLFILCCNKSLYAQCRANSTEEARVSISTPPMGFNSFDSYIIYLSETKANALIDRMAENINHLDMSIL